MSTALPPERSCMSASPRECAGSVETMSVRRPASAHRTAIALDVVVFPTPPLPPTKMRRCVEPSVESSRERGPTAGGATCAEAWGVARGVRAARLGSLIAQPSTAPASIASRAARRPGAIGERARRVG
eukprot:scaffold14543_cov30-Tisochrysis_lutea.AAC.4